MSNWSIRETTVGHRFQNGSRFAVVDATRRMYAAESIAAGESDKVIWDHLTGEADIGGIFDCSDESILIRAGVIPDEAAEDEAERLCREESRHIRYLNSWIQQESGVFGRR